MVDNTIKIFLALVSVFGGGWVKYYYDKKIKNLKEEIKDLSLSVKMDLEIFNTIKKTVDLIYENTVADRFLILTADNGTTEMKYATALYEQHKDNEKIFLSIGATEKYKKLKFDKHYKVMLKMAEHEDYVIAQTEFLPDSDLKNIYISEGVTCGIVFFLIRKKINEEKDRIFYCSVSTHDSRCFNDVEKIIIKASIDKLKDKFQEL